MLGTFRNAAAIALLIATSNVAFAQSDTSKVDLTGNWSFTVVYEGGQGSPTVRLVQKGDSITGRYISQAFGELDVKGSIKGREFSFWLTTSAGGDPFTMTFEGTVENANALKGAVELGGNGTATFTAVRQRNPDPAGSHERGG
ncbi:MAG TPA: hypothetical protein VFZ73_07400 [Gemmatimonadaceae bacterium]